jgi:hypothetical protein
MHPVDDEDTLREVLARRRGFLVNIWGSRTAAHDLQHLNEGCRKTLGITAQYPKFFAETADEIDHRLGSGQMEKRVPPSWIRTLKAHQ